MLRRRMPFTLFSILILSLSMSMAVDRPGGVLVDRNTNLLWVADAGHAISAGFSNRLLLTRSEANEFIESMNAGKIENFGLLGWRLASQDELEQIYLAYSSKPGSASIPHFTAFQKWFESSKVSRGGAWRSPGGARDSVFPWPVLAATAPDGFEDLIAFATSSLHVRNNTALTGNVVANAASTNTIVPGFEVSLARNASINGDVKADSVQLERDSSVTGTVFYNDLSNEGASPTPATVTPLPLPVFGTLPAFQQADIRPEAEDVVVGPGQTVILNDPDHLDITIDAGGTVVFPGGIYNIASITPVTTVGGQCPFPCRSLVFQGPSDVRIAGRLDMGKNSFIGPATNSSAAGPNIILYVGGTNLDPNNPNSLPPAATAGQSSSVEANIWAINGTVLLDKNSTLKGALLGRDVRIDRDIVGTIANFFNPAPTADDQTVFTNGVTPLDITLGGSDPDGEALSFTILTLPANGTLTDGVVPIVSVPHELSGDTVTYTAGQTGDFGDGFLFRASDTNCGIDDGEVFINPDGENPADTGDPPAFTNNVVAIDSAEETVENTALSIVLVGDADVADPDTAGDFAFTITSSPANGMVSAPLILSKFTAQVTYTPNMGFLSPPLDSFDFQACGDLTGDNDTNDPGECDTATVTIDVRPPAPPSQPESRDFAVTAAIDQSVQINLTTGATIGVPNPDDRPAFAPSTDIEFATGGASDDDRNNILTNPSLPQATALPVDGGWSTISCTLGQLCSGGPFTFTAPASGACISVTDHLLKGDQYQVTEGATVIGLTPLVPQDSNPNPSVSDFDVAYADPTYSSDTFFVGSGAHSIDVELTGVNAFNSASAGIRIDTPGSSAIYCGPDLTISSFTHDPASPDSETQIEITAVVANIGFASAGSSQLCIDVGGEVCGGAGTLHTVPSLPAGQSFSVKRFQTLPANTYLNNAVADSTDLVAESDETNNSATDTIVVTLAQEGTGLLVARIESLPSEGTLFDSSGVAITAVPVTLSDTRVTYVPPAGMTVNTTFMYSLFNTGSGLFSAVATVDLIIAATNCLIDEAACDDGRP